MVWRRAEAPAPRSRGLAIHKRQKSHAIQSEDHANAGFGASGGIGPVHRPSGVPPTAAIEVHRRELALGANSGTSGLGRAQYIEHVNLGFPGSVALHLEDPQSVTGNERFLSCWPDQLNTCFAQLISELAISPRFN